jgi:hypothetical protein
MTPVIIGEVFSMKRLTSIFGYAKLVIALRAFFFMQKNKLVEDIGVFRNESQNNLGLY